MIGNALLHFASVWAAIGSSKNNACLYYPEKVDMFKVDQFAEGKLSKALRNIHIEEWVNKIGGKTALVIELMSALPSLACFKSAVYDSFQDIEGMALGSNSKTDDVIGFIHTSAKQQHYSMEQLIQYTAIAMHNMYGLNKFTGNPNNKDLNKARGLLQLMGEKTNASYRMMYASAQITELDEFSFKTIQREMRFFIAEYYSKTNQNVTEIKNLQFVSFMNTTMNMGSDEAVALKDYLNKCTVFSDVKLCNGEQLVCKLIRRVRYYVKLHKYIRLRCRAIAVVVNQ
ncbi:hypothetical protein ECANGB1_595 [Enterospora canceri]|uniref:Uncharacterized protein n=1 Tax=Enterospora canceri TaxID=1081671 RepID=A0A1Y1S7S8_9MICR|nr:hypothetical protein ECANGB1_595 [Enterospora canceri]